MATAASKLGFLVVLLVVVLNEVGFLVTVVGFLVVVYLDVVLVLFGVVLFVVGFLVTVLGIFGTLVVVRFVGTTVGLLDDMLKFKLIITKASPDTDVAEIDLRVLE